MIKDFKGVSGAYFVYPIAEMLEKRKITNKVSSLKLFYKKPFEQRKIYSIDKLIETLEFSKVSVPYYKELFKKIGFEPSKLATDISYLNKVPYLTKDIILEQGDRLLSASLDKIKFHERKTGGSTGVSIMIYYDQIGLDYSAAITRFCRNEIGASPHKDEVHFAASFAQPPKSILPSKDAIKNFALNRNNIFFDKLNDENKQDIWDSLIEFKPHLIHGHPSTLYALACFLEDKKIEKKVFKIFESSGELLHPYMREKIKEVFGCQVIDRYGSAEFGVIGYELNGNSEGLKILDSEGWPETCPSSGEFVFTGFHNRLMPLIRYKTGDISQVIEKNDGFYMTNVVGRVHDIVNINGVDYPTHSIMDVLDHQVGGIEEFQVDVRGGGCILRLSIKTEDDIVRIKKKLSETWLANVELEFINQSEFIRVGKHAKFRHVVK